MNVTGELFTQAIVTLLGIFVGTLAALAVDRRNEQRQQQRRAKVVLRSLLRELSDNYQAVQAVKTAYTSTAWGRSFYLSTIAWETALAGGDLAEIIGFELADSIAGQYAWFVRMRYYVDLLTRLWLAPADIHGYEEIRNGFRRAIVEAMTQATGSHNKVIDKIKLHPAAAALAG